MELTEFEEKFTELVQNHGVIGSPDLWVKFLSKLREIMPPTCTATERKFLDEIREKFAPGYDSIKMIKPDVIGSRVCLFQKDFKTPLKKLVNE